MEDAAYAVQIYDMGIPLEKGITLVNVLQFMNLYEDTQSHYYHWCAKNHNVLLGLTSEFDNFKKDLDYYYFDSNIISKLKEVIKLMTNIEKHSRQLTYEPMSVTVMSGGMFPTIKNIEHKCFIILVSILLYLFSIDDVDIKMLQRLYRQTGGMKFISIGDKSNRLMYLIGYKKHEKRYVLKLTTQDAKIRNEILIYQELNVYTNDKPDIKEQIVRISKSGEVDPTDANIKIDIDDYRVLTISPDTDVDRWNKFYLLGMKRTGESEKLLYLVTEAADGYYKLRDYLKQRALDSVHLGYICAMTFKLLHRLNSDLGFIHWDLWVENLFVGVVEGNKLIIKLYDFDYSSTNANRSDALLSNSLGDDKRVAEIINKYSYTEFGFVYDVVRLVDSIYLNGGKCEFKDACLNTVVKLIDNETTKIPEDKYYHFHLINVVKTLSLGRYLVSKDSPPLTFYQFIVSCFRVIKGGYYYKYKKYKTKYLNNKYH